MSMLRTTVLISVAMSLACDADSSQKGELPDDDFSELKSGKYDSFAELESLGKITDGESLTANYNSDPTYRAFSFVGEAGDVATISVSSSNGDALLWLLNDEFEKIGFDDDSGAGFNSLLTRSIPADGTFHIVFREFEYENATFVVNLEGSGHELVDPPLAGDPFDPASCTGPSMTFNDALRFFGTAQDTSRLMATWDMYAYRQYCNEFTGCAQWEPVGNAEIQHQDGGQPGLSGELNLFLPETSPSMVIQPAMAQASEWEIEKDAVAIGSDIELGIDDIPGISYSESEFWTDTKAANGDERFDMVGRLTNECFRMQDDFSVSSGSNSTNYRIVFYGPVLE